MNINAGPKLIYPNAFMDKLGSVGYKGSFMLVKRAYQEVSWKNADFLLDMKVKEDIGSLVDN